MKTTLKFYEKNQEKWMDFEIKREGDRISICCIDTLNQYELFYKDDGDNLIVDMLNNYLDFMNEHEYDFDKIDTILD